MDNIIWKQDNELVATLVNKALSSILLVIGIVILYFGYAIFIR